MAMENQPPQQPQSEQPQQGGDAQQLVESIYKGLVEFQQMVAGAAPQVAEKLEQVKQAFQQVVEELVGGGGEEAPPQPKGPPAQRGPSAGGPGAVPM